MSMDYRELVNLGLSELEKEYRQINRKNLYLGFRISFGKEEEDQAISFCF